MKNLNPCSLEKAKAMAFYLGFKLVDDFPSIPILIEGDNIIISKLINYKNAHIPWSI